MKIVWDEPKRLANIAKHGIDLARAEEFDWEGALIRPARRGRYRAIGKLGEVHVSVIFVRLGSEALSVVSIRPASRAERRLT
jgi:uncharacterized DUF497 family protein